MLCIVLGWPAWDFQIKSIVKYKSMLEDDVSNKLAKGVGFISKEGS